MADAPDKSDAPAWLGFCSAGWRPQRCRAGPSSWSWFRVSIGFGSRGWINRCRLDGPPPGFRGGLGHRVGIRPRIHVLAVSPAVGDPPLGRGRTEPVVIGGAVEVEIGRLGRLGGLSLV